MSSVHCSESPLMWYPQAWVILSCSSAHLPRRHSIFFTLCKRARVCVYACVCVCVGMNVSAGALEGQQKAPDPPGTGGKVVCEPPALGTVSLPGLCVLLTSVPSLQLLADL